ncbi:methyl-accepting chemotaxis protein [Clostridium manihotivorum]|uniref:Methyl-accepting chemotaxis protein n=1 Tax=Clostridium manihotivorum TaxID=2320868 RepID=A0A3R5QUF0_9CLOT|nr:methyl-accepting chemotaxis protein [Clostridium manihotivorum]QAA32609.1 methyl-accepting chemotaxis protein [Clostridium manihotivorum]
MKIKSLRIRTLVSILPVTVVLLSILSLSSYFVSKNIISKEIDSKINNKMDELSLSISDRINANARVAESLARTAEISSNTISTDQYANLVKRYASINEDTLGTGIWFEANKYKNELKYYGPYAYKDGDKVVYTEDYMKEDYNYPSQPWYSNAKSTKSAVIWTPPYYDENTKLTMATAAAPFYDSEGKFMGATTADIELTNLQKIVNDINLGGTSKAFLLTKDGTYIAGVAAEKVMKSKISEDSKFSAISSNILSGNSGHDKYSNGNEKRIVYYEPVQGTDWVVGITVSNSEMYKSLQSLLNLLVIISIILIALIIISIVFFSNYLTNSIGKVTKLTSIISSGDMTHNIEVRSEDELGKMSKDLNNMTENLREVFGNILNSLDNIVGTSEELTASSEETHTSAEQVTNIVIDMSSKAQELAKNTEEISNVAEYINEGIVNISENVISTSKLSSEATDRAKSGEQVINDVIKHMGQISDQVSESAKIVNNLGEKSNKIDSIVSLINEISEQTNLLALNAAIEAARAGEQGKGFAVVADEVRKLAEQSGNASGEISKLIMEIQKEIAEAMIAMSSGNSAVDRGKDMIDNAGKSFNYIVNSIENVSKQMSAIVDVIGGIKESSQAMINAAENVSEVSRSNSNSIKDVASSSEDQIVQMQQVAEAAEALTGIVIELQSSISKFKI